MEILIEKKYKAIDGEIFENETRCATHEKQITDGGIYLRGQNITEAKLYDYLSEGYWLSNYDKGRLTIFYPSRDGGGSAGYVYGEIADKLGEIYDSWNYRIVSKRETIKRNNLS